MVEFVHKSIYAGIPENLFILVDLHYDGTTVYVQHTGGPSEGQSAILENLSHSFKKHDAPLQRNNELMMCADLGWVLWPKFFPHHPCRQSTEVWIVSGSHPLGTACTWDLDHQHQQACQWKQHEHSLETIGTTKSYNFLFCVRPHESAIGSRSDFSQWLWMALLQNDLFHCDLFQLEPLLTGVGVQPQEWENINCLFMESS